MGDQYTLRAALATIAERVNRRRALDAAEQRASPPSAGDRLAALRARVLARLATSAPCPVPVPNDASHAAASVAWHTLETRAPARDGDVAQQASSSDIGRLSRPRRPP